MAQQILPADRIRELASINEDVATMLKSAGQAINTLTGRTDAAQDDNVEMKDADNKEHSIDGAKRAFEKHVTDYYTSLQAVVARLRRQAYALEEAGIISSEAAALSNAPARPAQPGSTEHERITNGGLGNLDIGWLNSRGSQVGMEKENEILIEAKELLQDVLKQDDHDPA